MEFKIKLKIKENLNKYVELVSDYIINFVI